MFPLPIHALGGVLSAAGPNPPPGVSAMGVPTPLVPLPTAPLLVAIETGLLGLGLRLVARPPHLVPPFCGPAPRSGLVLRETLRGASVPAVEPQPGPAGGVCLHSCGSGPPPLTAPGASRAPVARDTHAPPAPAAAPAPATRAPGRVPHSRALAGLARKVSEGRGARSQHPYPTRAFLRQAADLGG